MGYSWRTGCGSSDRSPGTTLRERRSTAWRRRWPAESTRGETTSVTRHSNHSIPKTRMTKRVMRVPTSSLPLFSRRELLINTLRTLKTLLVVLRLSFSRWPILRPDSYWYIWSGAEVKLLNPCQRTQDNQPWRGPRSHQESQGQQSSGPERYPEQVLEASSPARGFPPVSDLQCCPPKPPISPHVEARSRDLYP